MSNPELGAERREDRGPAASGEESRDELKSILDTIAAQLQDADRRHSAALNEMQHRISGMGREADLLRARIPGQFAPAFEQIEAGIGELAHRLADAGRGARGEAQSARHRASVTRREAELDPSSPWDQHSAEALADVYESSGYTASRSVPDEGAASNIDEAWLESRFAEIARGIEYSLANVKTETAFTEFEQRFDHFERQFAKLFAGVATHDDLTSVRQIGAHMETVVSHLEKTNDQLERLNTIETQLANVSKTLAEMRVSQSQSPSSSPDIDAVARAVAEETAQRFAARQNDASNLAADELRPLIEQLMTENRQGGEQTAALLETMQQAMVRLLDRADAIEAAQQPPRRFFETDPLEGYRTGTDVFGSDVVPGEDLSRGYPQDAFAEDNSDHAFASEPVPPPLSVRSESGMSPEEMALRSEKLRQEFIADARRAKMRLSAEGDDLETAASLSVPRTYGSGAATAGHRPIRPSAKAPKNTSGPSGPSPLLMIVAGVVLAALAGLWYVFGFETQTPSISVQPAVSETGGRSDAVKGAPLKSETPAAHPSSPTGEAPAPGPNGPRGDLTPNNGGVVPASDARAQNDEPRTALPMLGVAVDLGRPMTKEDLLRARRHQAMANISGELGNAAARPGEAAILPASMIPTESETEGVGPERPNGMFTTGAVRSPQLDMPPAMIGPLSLRLSAAKGDPSAQFEVGARFAGGEGVKQNFAEAAKWYQRSADQGFAQAEYRLGTLYERGLGLKSDRAQATAWYLRSAEKGNIKAMHNLAVLSANQTDRAPDYTTAAQWFERAAQRGLPDSQFNLAILYENGLGVPRDMAQSFMWLSLAAQGGDADAIRRRDILRGKLSAQEIAQAQKMLAAWRMVPSDRTVNDALAAGELWKKNSQNGMNG